MIIARVSRSFIWGVMLWCGVATALAEPQTGPVVPSFGPVLPPPEGAYSLDADTHYKVSIDVGETAEFPGRLWCNDCCWLAGCQIFWLGKKSGSKKN